MMKISIFHVYVEEAAKQTGRPLLDILADLKAEGLEALEMDAAWMREHPAEMKEMLDVGLEISSIYEVFDLGNQPDQDLTETVKLALAYGVKNVMLIPGFLDPQEMPVYVNDEQMMQEMGKNPKILHMRDGVRRAVEFARSTDVDVTMEPYGSPTTAPYGRVSHLLWFANEIPGLKMTFDTGNFIFADEDALSAFDALADITTHIHCKSYNYDENEAPGRFRHGILPSAIYDGYIPLWHILDRFDARGYDRYLVIEQDKMTDHYSAALKAIRYLKAFNNRKK